MWIFILQDAWELGNARIPRPWSWYTKEKEKLNEKKNLVSSGQIKTGKKSASKTNVIDDPKLLEFLHVMQPQSKSKCWMNDELAHGNFVTTMDFSIVQL